MLEAEEVKQMPYRFKPLNRRNIILHALYVLLAFLIQYALIASFIYAGLKDIVLLEIPLGKGLKIGILFHLIPLNVILVLYYIWIYVMRYKTTVPTEMTRRKAAAAHKMVKEFKSSKRLIDLLASFMIPSSIIAFFAFLLLTLFILLCPSILNNLAKDLYYENVFFRGLITRSAQANTFLTEALGPFAASIRINMESLIKPLAASVSGLDLTWKYLACQNIAAWVTALYMLIYLKHRMVKR